MELERELVGVGRMKNAWVMHMFVRIEPALCKQIRVHDGCIIVALSGVKEVNGEGRRCFTSGGLRSRIDTFFSLGKGPIDVVSGCRRTVRLTCYRGCHCRVVVEA